MFRVGQKVVALKSTTIPVMGYLLIKGEIYTCAGYSKHSASTPKKEMLIKEQYLINGNNIGEKYCCAPESWFRALKLDYNFVEEVIKQVQPQTQEA